MGALPSLGYAFSSLKSITVTILGLGISEEQSCHFLFLNNHDCHIRRKGGASLIYMASLIYTVSYSTARVTYRDSVSKRREEERRGDLSKSLKKHCKIGK